MSVQELISQIKKFGLSDREIGARTNITQPTVTRLKNGKHATTSNERFKALEALLASIK